MRRLATFLLAASMAGGCVNSAPKNVSGDRVASWDRRSIRNAPGYCGPYGEKVPMQASAMTAPPPARPVPLIKSAASAQATPQNTIQQASAFGPAGPVIPANHPMAGPQFGGASGGPSPNELAANSMPRFPAQRTQVRFSRPSGMKISWFTQSADGKSSYPNMPIDAPGRYNFPQAAIYRLKLSNIEGRPGLEVYPTMEVVPTNPKTESFLAHSAVPVEFTQDDFKQIAEGAYIVKVIYLPDPQFQDAASTGTEEILSTRLEPGVDPIQEALRRGCILLVIRMGNVDQEAPNTPPLNSAAPGGAAQNSIMNFGPMNPGQPGQSGTSMVPFGPPGGYQSGGPGSSMPPGLMTTPGNLPPALSGMPLPRNSSPGVPGTPINRPGTATATSPLPNMPPAPPQR